MSHDSDDDARRVLPSRIAHEIRTPLGVLMGALAQFQDPNPATAKTLELAHRAVAQLARLSDRLSLLSRAATGFADGLEVQPVSIGAAVRQAMQVVQASRRRRGVTVNGPDADVDAHVAADPRMLVAAIAEVVDNAVRYASTRVDVTIAIRDDHAIVTVEDDGPGVDEERRALLFQLSLGPGRPGGLGIGTWLAAEIVGRFGGRIEAPIVDHRTRFELVVPTVRG
jgi:two-component system sensor histidine kinase TctE